MLCVLKCKLTYRVKKHTPNVFLYYEKKPPPRPSLSIALSIYVIYLTPSPWFTPTFILFIRPQQKPQMKKSLSWFSGIQFPHFRRMRQCWYCPAIYAKFYRAISSQHIFWQFCHQPQRGFVVPLLEIIWKLMYFNVSTMKGRSPPRHTFTCMHKMY